MKCQSHVTKNDLHREYESNRNKLSTVIKESTIKPIEVHHSWDHSKVVVLDRWSSYKTPL